MSVAGIAGLFIACRDPVHVREWYRRHLGLGFSVGEGVRFTWREVDSGRSSDTRFDFIDEASRRLNPGIPPVVVRYLVRDLETLAETLPEGGDGLTMREGRYGWMIDPDGRRVELCEVTAPAEPPVDHGRVTGIGGVFLRSPDPAALKAWYARLGVRPGPDGYVTFPARSIEGDETFTAWEVFPSNTTYFDSKGEPSPHRFMLNLRVQDLDGLVASLRGGGVWVDPNTEACEYGKFAWIVDPTGARVELWEPAPAAS